MYMVVVLMNQSLPIMGLLGDEIGVTTSKPMSVAV